MRRAHPPAFNRRPLVVANWKMYLGATEQVRAARSIQRLLGSLPRQLDLVLCPSFPLLSEIRAAVTRRGLLLGAQDVHPLEHGPYTGDVSIDHIRRHARYVIVGHSERRTHHHETDELVAQKATRVLTAGLHPIICVGETADERENGETIQKLRRQVETVLKERPVLDLPRIVFAYEPLWAISTGLGNPAPQPEPRDVAELVGFVRKTAATIGGRRYAEKMRVVYGGSVTARTVRPFVEQPGVDGVLVGAASTNPAEYITIAREVAACHS